MTFTEEQIKSGEEEFNRWPNPRDGIESVMGFTASLVEAPLLARIEIEDSTAESYLRGCEEAESQVRVLKARIAEIDAQIEQERTQHAGCLTYAEGNSLDDSLKQGDYGWSLANSTVKALRIRTDELEAQVDWLFNHCKIIYFPGQVSGVTIYPVEHNLLAHKDNRRELEQFAELAAARKEQA